MSDKKITAKDYNGHERELVQVEWCEHCGEVPKQWGTKTSTTWCNLCSDADGVDVDALLKRKGRKQ